MTTQCHAIRRTECLVKFHPLRIISRRAFGARGRDCFFRDFNKPLAKNIELKMFGECLPCRVPEPANQLAIAKTTRNRDRHGARVFRRNEQGVYVIAQPFTHAAHFGADNRFPETHRFEQDDGHGFVTRRADEDICAAQQINRLLMRLGTQQLHVGNRFAFFSERIAKGPFQRTTSHLKQRPPAQIGMKIVNRFQQNILAFSRFVGGDGDKGERATRERRCAFHFRIPMRQHMNRAVGKRTVNCGGRFCRRDQRVGCGERGREIGDSFHQLQRDERLVQIPKHRRMFQLRRLHGAIGRERIRNDKIKRQNHSTQRCMVGIAQKVGFEAKLNTVFAKNFRSRTVFGRDHNSVPTVRLQPTYKMREQNRRTAERHLMRNKQNAASGRIVAVYLFLGLFRSGHVETKLPTNTPGASTH